MTKIYKKVLFCLFLLSCNNLFAQQFNSSIQSFLDDNLQELAVLPSDVSDWVVMSEQYSKVSGVTHVYIRQRHAGIDVSNGLANFSMKNNKVLYMGNNLVAQLAAKANALRPQISASDAIVRAATELGLLGVQSPQLIQQKSPQDFLFSNANISQDEIPVKLMYQATEDGELRLAWDITINTKDNKHWWSLRLDALTGKVIDQQDWILSCNFSKCKNIDHPNHFLSTRSNSNTKNNNLIDAPLFASEELPNSTKVESAFPPPSTDQYNVFAIPVESPNHGARTLLVGPFDPTASPFGWHDTDGTPGAESTFTLGNNVLSQEDANGNNGTGTRTNGGASLDFNLPLNLNQAPAAYQDVSIVNLFYMNNIMHDVWYHYGFDEASGNFQENTYGNGGTGGDRVLADAQDGSGLNNANFGTPTDGNNPRMQMFLWNAPAAQNLLTVNSPASLARSYLAIEAGFGPAVPAIPLTANFVLVDDNTNPDPQDACEGLVNAAAISGNIAVIRRGACSFVNKVVAAEAAGAIAVIMVNNAGAAFVMGGADPGIGIPSVMVAQTEGEAFITAIQGGQTLNGTLQDPGGPFQLDGDFDNGIVAHEYGHGISNRLAGGRFNSNCLSNDEQMGEGWSDWFALMLTIEPGDLGPDARGIGTFAIGEPTSGGGIRPMPYSTNTAVNNATYDLTNNTGAISRPHGIGFVWCTMLWDLSWAYIDTYGYDNDLYNGTGGNNMVMALVLEGLKMQPCSPGFVDGRDGLLAADVALTGGVNQCLIWNVFAARGVGQSADQGSSNSRTDQTEAFNLPAGITSPLSSCVASLAPLPIELLSFGASPIDNRMVSCVWTTASELNNDYFTVERSIDGIHFEMVGTISSKGDQQNVQEYFLMDEQPFSGTSYYRLKQTDNDGRTTHSKVVVVEIEGDAAIQIVPNPNKGAFQFIIETKEAYELEYAIYSVVGTLVQQATIQQEKGINSFDINIMDQPSGTYLVVLNDKNGQFSTTKRIVKH